mmetsp:Transcript_24488/g.36009  ORF Transcript_24488/g.36009 Transcript_24488/m.36009 type:complete len:542 (+) Transcript_24488:65-1690(+)|eukprot:CAMPEP_0185026610 /NCGR_PEP_ID=MMETSP1103-20130426/10960_1 /TAXON_ID=36769 /ORGANISM="Paraphysomonas bandaiensis, Strain Caron Lab Isolate" /LENGTH=541 /DNA_ID=CAMNT_0027560251 /DNA_START=54 /DNA_END=1679 /DNA_ORIENTATION=+
MTHITLFTFTITLIPLLCVCYDQKPQYHITPDDGHWLNDPNGPMYYNGYYHLFFQYNPHAPVWGDMSWAHVVSTDMVYWQRLNVALYNDQWYDIGGVFSGSAAINNSSPYLLYTCVDSNGVELQCAASRDASSTTYDTTLEDWVKDVKNPVINSVPSGWDIYNFRDPALFTTNQEEQWNMLTAASDNGDGIIALHTTSAQDFPYGWTYKNPVWRSSDPASTHQSFMVECPDFFPVDSDVYEVNTDQVYIMKYSVMETTQDFYEVGRYVSDSDTSADVFTRDLTTPADLQLDYGPHRAFYASKSFYDAGSNTRFLWGWSMEQDDQGESRGWQGVQSLPRTVSYDPDMQSLRLRPYSKLSSLRSATVYSSLSPPISGDIPATGLQVEVQAEFTISAACNVFDLEGAEMGMQVRRSSDGQYFTSYGFALGVSESAEIMVFTSMDSSVSGGSTPPEKLYTPVPTIAFQNISDNGDIVLSMQLFLDHSITEMFAQDGALAATLRIYPEESYNGMGTYVFGGNYSGNADCFVGATAITVYEMGTIWQ